MINKSNLDNIQHTSRDGNTQSMNFQQLKCVIAVADTGSFTKAAELCCITQPALSNSINMLEEELGGKLFERTTRSVSMTEFGEYLIGTIRETIDTRGKLLNSAADYLTRDETNIRIGLSPLISSDYVEDILKRARSLEQPLNLVLTDLNKSDIEPALVGGVIDYGLEPEPVASDNKSLRCSTIYTEPLMYVSTERNTGVPEDIYLSDIADGKFLLTPDSCGLAGATRTLFRQNQVSLSEYEGHALGYHILEKWALLGIGVTLLPASKISDMNHAQRVLQSNGTSANITFQACWNESRQIQSNFQAMGKVLGLRAA